MKTTIEQVNMADLKGRTGCIHLKPLTAIVAPNSMGKTAVTDALKLALTGKHPVQGSKGQALMELASGTTMGVGCHLTDGTHVSRGWVMNKAGSVKATHNVPDGFDASASELIFSPGLFLAMSDKDRVATLLRLGGETSVTTSEVETLRDTLESKCTGSSRVTVSEFDPFADAMTDAGVMLEAADGELVEARKAHKRDVARLANTVKGLEDAAAKAEAPVKVDAKEIDALSNELKKLAEEAARIGERHREALRKRTRAEGVDASSHWTREDATELETLGCELAKAETAAAAVAKAKEDLRAVLAAGAEPEEVEAARSFVAGFVEQPAPTQSREAANEALKRSNEESIRVTNDLAHVARKCKEIEIDRSQAEAMSCCPTCGAQGDDFKARLLAGYDDQLKQLQALKAEHELKAKAIESEADDAKATLEKWKASDELIAARKLITEDELHDQQVKELRLQVQHHEAQTGDLEKIRAKARSKREHRDKADLAKQLGDVPSVEQVASLKQAIDELEAKRVELEGQHNELKAKQAAWQEWGAQEGHTARAREELEAATGKLEETESLILATRKAKAALAAKIVEPLATDVRYFTNDVLPGKVRIDQGLGLHYETEGMVRPFRALSGSEQAVIAFALAAALASRTQLGVAILDEASTMDVDRKQLFFDRVAVAVADGKLAQAIVIDHDGRTSWEGWHVEKLGKTSPVMGAD